MDGRAITLRQRWEFLMAQASLEELSRHSCDCRVASSTARNLSQNAPQGKLRQHFDTGEGGGNFPNAAGAPGVFRKIFSRCKNSLARVAICWTRNSCSHSFDGPRGAAVFFLVQFKPV